MEIAIKIIGLAAGIIAAFQSYPWLNQYMLVIFAVIVAIAIAVVVYALVVGILGEILRVSGR